MSKILKIKNIGGDITISSCSSGNLQEEIQFNTSSSTAGVEIEKNVLQKLPEDIQLTFSNCSAVQIVEKINISTNDFGTYVVDDKDLVFTLCSSGNFKSLYFVLDKQLVDSSNISFLEIINKIIKAKNGKLKHNKEK